ncbi:hypothetical protein ScPMuIL_015393 [Solemya velum]
MFTLSLHVENVNVHEMEQTMENAELFKEPSDIGIYEDLEIATKDDFNMPSASPAYDVDDIMDFLMPEFKEKDNYESCGNFQTTPVPFCTPGFASNTYQNPFGNEADYSFNQHTPCFQSRGQSLCSQNDIFIEYEHKHSNLRVHDRQSVTPSSISDMDTSRLVDEFQCKMDADGQSKVKRSPESRSRQSSFVYENFLNGSKFPAYTSLQQPGASTFRSWTCKHPENWEPNEVLDWLYFSAESNGIDGALLHGEAFQSVSGKELCQMQSSDFECLGQYGVSFYSLFRVLYEGLNFSKPTELKSTKQPSSEIINTCLGSDNPNSFDNIFCSLSEIDRCESGSKSDIGTTTMYGLIRDAKTNDGFGVAEPTNLTRSSFAPMDDTFPAPPPRRTTSVSGRFVDDLCMRRPSPCCTVKSPDSAPPRRRPGRPRIKSLPPEVESRAQKDKKAKNQHLWEFIYGVLMNPSYNPQYLRWENQREGVFRFVQSEAVAHLWGSLKNNENMTYEKLSRAMRHYYKRGILERVEGRRLVYKFSRKAIDKCREKIRMNSV